MLVRASVFAFKQRDITIAQLWCFGKGKINFNLKSSDFLKETCVCTKHRGAGRFICRKPVIMSLYLRENLKYKEAITQAEY